MKKISTLHKKIFSFAVLGMLMAFQPQAAQAQASGVHNSLASAAAAVAKDVVNEYVQTSPGQQVACPDVVKVPSSDITPFGPSAGISVTGYTVSVQLYGRNDGKERALVLLHASNPSFFLRARVANQLNVDRISYAIEAAVRRVLLREGIC